MRRTVFVSGGMVLVLAAAAAAQVRLEPQNREGTRTLVNTMSVRQVLSIVGQDVPTNVDVTTITTSVTGKPEADGTIRVSDRTDRMKFQLTAPGGLELTFDSEKPDPKVDNDMLKPILDALKAVVGNSYTRVIKGNKVIDVEGVDKILAKAGAGADQLRSQLDPDKIKREFSQDLGRLPDGAVKVGDRWKRTEVVDFGQGQTMTYVHYYEYQGTVQKDGKSYDKIGLFTESATYSLDKNSPIPLKFVSGDLKVDSSIGTFLFDRELGEMAEATTSSRVVGPMTFNVNGMDLPAKLDLTITSSTARKK